MGNFPVLVIHSMQAEMNGKKIAEAENSINTKGIRVVMLQLIDCHLFISQEAEEFPAERVTSGKYYKWKTVLGVMVLLLAVLYPFKIFFE